MTKISTETISLQQDTDQSATADSGVSLPLVGEFINKAEVLSFTHSYYHSGMVITHSDCFVDSKLPAVSDALVSLGAVMSMADGLGCRYFIRPSGDLSVMMDVSGCYLYIIATPDQTAKLSDALSGLLNAEERIDDYELNIDYYMMDVQGKIACSPVSRWTSDFAYLNDDLYPKIDVDSMLDAFMQSDETILILTGDPGTGKTSLIKRIMVHFAPKIDMFTGAYVKDERILHESVFWNKLTDAEYELIIFDDLDDALSSRDTSENNAFVNNLLSHSDGVFDTKSKFIITTNRNIESIDPALIRPGRCFDMLSMPALTRAEALVFWKSQYSLSSELFDEVFGDLDVITQAHVTSEGKRAVSDTSKTYLLDNTISVRSTYMNKNKSKKTIGFM